MHAGIRPNSELTFWDPLPPGVAERARKLVLTTSYTAPAEGAYRFAVAGVGSLRLDLEGETAAEAIAPPPADVMEVFSQPLRNRLRAWELHGRGAGTGHRHRDTGRL